MSVYPCLCGAVDGIHAMMGSDRRGNRSKGAAGTAESGGVLSRLYSWLAASILDRAYSALTCTLESVTRRASAQFNQQPVATINSPTSHRPWHHLCSTSNSTLIFPAPKRLGMGIKRRAAFEKSVSCPTKAPSCKQWPTEGLQSVHNMELLRQNRRWNRPMGVRVEYEHRMHGE